MRALCNVLLFFTMIGIASCASEGEQMRAAGQNPAYSMAFDQGCDSGYNAGGNMFYTFKKDAARYGTDQYYAQGWNDGYQQCYGRQTSSTNMLQTEYMRENVELNREATKNNQYKGYVKPGTDYDPALLNKLGK